MKGDAVLHKHMDNSSATVLILEPDHTQRDLMALALRHHHFQVVLAMDWMDALALLQQRRPEVMLLAGLLPQINGIDFLRYCKSQGWIEHTSVILITALEYREIVHKAKAAGAADVLVKPVVVNTLIQKVQKYLDSNGGSRYPAGL